MPSERAQRRVERLLDQADAAADGLDWEQVAQCVRMVLCIDPENADALVFETMLQGEATAASEDSKAPAPSSQPLASPPGPEPASFANGRYEVRRLLGEGGKKKVYLAHDTTLDRDVAFALIKTDGFDDISRHLGLTRR